MNKIEELKIKAFDIRDQIDQIEQQKIKLVDEYNQIILEIMKYKDIDEKK